MNETEVTNTIQNIRKACAYYNEQERASLLPERLIALYLQACNDNPVRYHKGWRCVRECCKSFPNCPKNSATAMGWVCYKFGYEFQYILPDSEDNQSAPFAKAVAFIDHLEQLQASQFASKDHTGNI